MRQRIFIGSSSEKLHIARAIHADLSNNHEPTIWNQGIFGLSQDVLSGLLEQLTQTDAAVLILAPDDLLSIRDSECKVSRDNVIFELGLFMGRLGREKTYFVVPHGCTCSCLLRRS